MKQPDFLYVDTNSHKLKVNQKIFGLVWPEMCLASPVNCFCSIETAID